MTDFLGVKQLSLGHGGRRPYLLSGLEFQVPPKGAVVFKGPNGIGKTTLLKTLLGEIPAAEGQVSWSISQNRVALIPQTQTVDFHLPLTLRDVLEISVQEYSETEALRWELVEKKHLDLAWSTASGGERKRTLLTRALMQNPEVIIADEPLNHLDREGRKQVSQALAHFLSLGKGGIFVSHYELEFPEEVSIESIDLEDFRPEVSSVF